MREIFYNSGDGKSILSKEKNMKNLSVKWQKAIVWFTGYINVIAFFLAGGYTYLNTECDDVKASAKNVFVLLLGFTGIDILRAIVYNIMSVADASYKALSVVSDIGTVVSVIRMIVFVTFFILDLHGFKFTSIKATAETPKESTEEDNADKEN